jgi:hypothetical protein
MSVEAGTLTRPTPPRVASGVALLVLALLFVAGLASLLVGVTDDAVRIDLPLLTVSFLYLMGVTQAGVVFAAIMRLVGAEWSKPYYRIAELATVAFFPFAIAGFAFIVLYGREELFYWLAASPDDHVSPWLDFNWLLARNLLALLLFYALAGIYAWKSVLPDLRPAVRDSAGQARNARQLYLMSPFVIIAFVVCNTFISWDLGMMLIEHWHSTVFPIHFSFGNLFAATAALILLPVILGGPHVPGSHFGPHQVRNLGMLITGFTLMWLYFYWAQFFVMWFGNLPHETEPLWRQMYGHYAPYYWSMLAGCFFFPLAALIFAAVKRSVAALTVVAITINAGIWINKYLIVVPVYSPAHRPFASWVDIGVALGLFAGFIALLLLLARRVPACSHWEITRREP